VDGDGDFADREIPCVDCGQPFVFTAGEQAFYAQKGFQEPPRRCKACRDARRQRKLGRESSVAREPAAEPRGPSGPRPPRPAGRSSDRRDSRPGRASGKLSARLHPAKCTTCGADALVPFKPSAGRPVYCKDCFASRKPAR